MGQRLVKHLVGLKFFRGVRTSSISGMVASRMSTEKVPVSKVNISKHLVLRSIQPGSSTKTGPAKTKTRPPLVLFFPWLNAPPKAVDKYCGLYHQWGLDVLCINSKAVHFLWPSTSQVLVKEVLEYLETQHQGQDKLNEQLLFVHAMSVGAFVYTMMIMEIHKQSSKYGFIPQNTMGIVFDSIVIGGLSQMGVGVAKGITKNSVIGALIRAVIATYFTVTHSYTTKLYDVTVDFFIYHPVMSPTLMIYSKNDPMSDPDAMSKLLEVWIKKLNMDVQVQCWNKSVHAGHLMKHTDDYVKAHDQFMTKMGMNRLTSDHLKGKL